MAGRWIALALDRQFHLLLVFMLSQANQLSAEASDVIRRYESHIDLLIWLLTRQQTSHFPKSQTSFLKHLSAALWGWNVRLTQNSKWIKKLCTFFFPPRLTENQRKGWKRNVRHFSSLKWKTNVIQRYQRKLKDMKELDFHARHSQNTRGTVPSVYWLTIKYWVTKTI